MNDIASVSGRFTEWWHTTNCGRCPHPIDGAFFPGSPVSFRTNVSTAAVEAICPDLLRFEQIGEADGWRGRLVRAFFWLLRAWPP